MGDIKQLRGEIDAIDEQIIRFLAERVKVCEAVGAAKKKQRLPVHDFKREEELFESLRARSTELGLNPLQVEAVYREIVNMCSAVQE